MVSILSVYVPYEHNMSYDDFYWIIFMEPLCKYLLDEWTNKMCETERKTTEKDKDTEKNKKRIYV